MGKSAEPTLHAALDIGSCTSLTDIQKIVRRFAQSFGYDRVVMLSTTTAREELVEKVYWIEGDWFGTSETVDAEVYFRRCPVTRHILDTREPFYWSKKEQKDGSRYRVVKVPNGLGIHGLQIPLYGPQGLEGAMSFGGTRIVTSATAKMSMSIVAKSAFFAARKLFEAPASLNGSSLSKREREILAWTATGRRQADIAASLGISMRTVENHLRQARRRLGVSTTAQAISVATRSGALDT